MKTEHTKFTKEEANKLTYLELCDLSYDDLVSCLNAKYGTVKKNYFAKKSYENFLEDKNNGPRRLSEKGHHGLWRHHVNENKYKNLSRPSKLLEEGGSYDNQTKENLVFCNLIEHVILHVLIGAETAGEFGWEGVGGIFGHVRKWYLESEDVSEQWQRIYRVKSFLYKEEVLEIREKLESIIDNTNTNDDKRVNKLESTKVKLKCIMQKTTK